ncbi:DNA methyltransferase [Pseudomonas sp. GGS8]|uniref:DNA methyltransferase n=1 Tax=Pseudomonas sp. GGS8 TaxID=2817892 RepID=UPI0034616A55
MASEGSPNFSREQEIFFAYQNFYWSNNAGHNANVICIVVGVSTRSNKPKRIYTLVTSLGAKETLC